MFGPAMTKWYQLLNRIQFKSPTKAIVYRVRPAFTSFGQKKLNVHRYGLTNVY
jgi:protein Mpv17